MTSSELKIKPNSLGYRLATILSSIKALYQLTPEQVDSFLKSYEIYDCDWVDGKAVKDSEVVAYREIQEKLITWYKVLNLLCAIGEVEKMYIPPALDLSAGVIENQLLFERKFCAQLGMKAGDRVLDLGCGRGRVAAHLASITGAHVTGINIDQTQLDYAQAYAKKNGLSCTFLKQDFNDLPLPFPDHSFDCVYEIQAMSLSRDLDKLFKELSRITKPGGKFSILDWVRLPAYDPQNPHHADLMRRMKPFIGAIGTPTPEEFAASLQKAGFDVLVSEDPSVKQHQGPLIDNAGRYFDYASRIIKSLVWARIFPKHFVVLFDRLAQDSDSLSEAEQLGLVTTSYHIIAEKRQFGKETTNFANT